MICIKAYVPRGGKFWHDRLREEEEVLVANAIRVTQPPEPRAEGLELVLRDRNLKVGSETKGERNGGRKTLGQTQANKFHREDG